MIELYKQKLYLYNNFDASTEIDHDSMLNPKFCQYEDQEKILATNLKQKKF